MKVIDLLNKIANGEEAPKKIRAYENFWVWNKEQEEYIQENKGSKMFGLFCDFLEGTILDSLNDEVEILEEEKKIPEKLEIYEDEEGHYFIDNHCKKIYITCDEVNFMVEEFNQLIDYLNSKGDK